MLPQQHNYDGSADKYAIINVSPEAWAMLRASCQFTGGKQSNENDFAFFSELGYKYDETNYLTVEHDYLTDAVLKENFAAPLRQLARMCASLDEPDYDTAHRLELAASDLADASIQED